MTQELKKALEEEKIVFGTDRTLKKLRNKDAKKVFIANNCTEDIKKNIERYAEVTKAVVVKLRMNNEELGAFCKKPFKISVLSY